MNSPESEDCVPPFYVGQHESQRSRPVTDELVRRAHECNYDMLTAPITTSAFHQRVLALVDDLGPESATTVSPLTMHDTDLGPSEMAPQLIAVVSPWIDLCSPDPVIYSISRQVLHLEVAYAAFCGVTNVIVPGPVLHHGNIHDDGVAQYAYTMQEVLEIGLYVQVHVRLPMIDDPGATDDHASESLRTRGRPEFMDLGASIITPKPDIFGTWDAWNIVRSTCKYNARLFVALDLYRILPPLSIQSRWRSEPLRIVIFSASTFSLNDGGYPILSRAHQSLITNYMRLRSPPWILLSDIGAIPGTTNRSTPTSTAIADTTADSFPLPSEAATQLQKKSVNKSSSSKPPDPTPHLSYFRYLQGRQPPRTILERFGAGFQDYLQSPLQPLTDNLESVTYEVFEKDPVKYEWYERAIARALSDWSEAGKCSSGPDNRIVVAVVGAGRGPLVTRALRASEAVGVDIELWAVEKNPNASVLLERHNASTWNHQVNVLRSDMRSWKGPLRTAISTDDGGLVPGPPTAQLPGMYTPIDILISELLGSFGDNELSPECLDGILPLLNPRDGLCIPRSYTAFTTPIAAPKLHADISARTPKDPSAPDTPYVVMLQAIDYLSSTATPSTMPTSVNAKASMVEDPQPNILPVWSFIHGPTAFPAPSTNSHNTRQARLTFRTRDRGVCHGLAGYFETVLYPGVELSTNPLTMEAKSDGMMSWFPIFFPLKTPLYIPDHAELTVTMRRCTDERKVWYEWLVESWGWNILIGGDKKRVRLGVSEVGSSKAGGCMM